jgi:hypothetical protein
MPHVSTGFPQLDAITGCGGAPLGAMTLLSGRTTSGKLTLAYKTLVHAQGGPGVGGALHSVAILDLTHSSDPDYLSRCGLQLSHLLLVRPQSGRQAVDLLLDLVRSRQFRALLVDSLADLRADRDANRYLNAVTAQLNRFVLESSCGLICLDEPQPPWLRWLQQFTGGGFAQTAALHLELQRERWLQQDGELRGYTAQAQVMKSRWARSGQTVSLEIRFNGTVQAGRTW